MRFRLKVDTWCCRWMGEFSFKIHIFRFRFSSPMGIFNLFYYSMELNLELIIARNIGSTRIDSVFCMKTNQITDSVQPNISVESSLFRAHFCTHTHAHPCGTLALRRTFRPFVDDRQWNICWAEKSSPIVSLASCVHSAAPSYLNGSELWVVFTIWCVLTQIFGWTLPLS